MASSSPAATPPSGPRTVRAALVDINGTLYVGSEPVPGAVQALQRLRGAGVAVRFVTNTTKQTVGELLRVLRRLGFDIQPHEVRLRAAARLKRPL
jgi:ribonucleotide monophosphatase NagD (HAD superfamily)